MGIHLYLCFVKTLAVLFGPFVLGHKPRGTMSSGCRALCDFTGLGVGLFWESSWLHDGKVT